ncbi:MAG TPA: hypothetical protein VJR03_07360 [Nitrospira sp.]|nr:hypothetical protein [Nitrospira sp.]
MIPITRHLITSVSRQLALTSVLVLGIPGLTLCASDEQIVDELIDLSGLKQQIPRLPNEYLTLVDQVLMGLERQRHPVPKSLRRQIRQSFADALASETLESQIHSRLLDALSQDTTLATVTWLRSDLAKKITAAEVNVGSPERSVQLATFLLQLQLERPAPQRLQLVRRIEEITQGSEMATQAWEAIVEAVARALEGVFRGKNPQGKEQLEEYMASIRGSIKGMFQQGRLFEALFTYQTLTDDELQRYAEFLETPTGRDVTKTINGVVQGVAIDAIRNIQPLPFKNPLSPADRA